MILRLELPFLDTTFPKGVLTAWRVTEKQAVAYGKVFCEVTCFDRYKLRGTSLAAHKLMRTASRGGEEVEYRWRKGKVEVVYEVVASEPAELVAIQAQVGTEVATGDLLGLVAIGADPYVLPSSPPPQGSPKLRVVARTLETAERNG
ncbi:MAG: hypothetical protein ACRDWA_05895 [Acidimicrobiia bacterium]